MDNAIALHMRCGYCYFYYILLCKLALCCRNFEKTHVVFVLFYIRNTITSIFRHHLTTLNDHFPTNTVTCSLLYHQSKYLLLRVHNIIGEESVLLCNSLQKRVLQSYDTIVIVTFEVLSDHVTF